MAKRRPVLIIQNNLGNKKSTTTICLCLSTKCKFVLPYHVHFSDLNIVNRESDICAEQIKTIDQCRSTPMHLAVVSEKVRIVKRLLQSGADKTKKDKKTPGKTPYDIAKEKDEGDCTRI